MKGKLILTDIQSPVEGMQVVWQGQIHIISGFSDSKRWVDFKDLGELACRTSELKQIEVGIFHPSHHLNPTLPLHPDDWKWAIEHMGEEVEFEIKKRDILDNSKCTCKTSEDWKKCEHFIGPPINDCLQIEIVKFDMAKLIHPTPITKSHYPHDDVIYTGKEVEIMMNSLYWDVRHHVKEKGKVGAKWWYDWWNEHKKK